MKVFTGMSVEGDLHVSGNITCGGAKTPIFVELQPVRYDKGWYSLVVEGYGTVEAVFDREALLWLADNAMEKYLILQHSIEFKSEDDAMTFYMRYS